MRSRLSSPAVSGVSGQHRTTTSLSATSSSTLTKRDVVGQALRIAAVGDHVEAEAGPRDRHDGLADIARPDNAQRAPMQFVRLVRMGAPGQPAALAQVTVHRAKTPEQRHGDEEHVLGDRAVH